MVAPILYRSTDASAPSLTGSVGSLITVLDACLVNGYGAKAAAGWTKDYSGTNKAAYRMGAGGSADRMFLRVWDDNTGAGHKAYMNAYRTMSSVDVGTRQFMLNSQMEANLQGCLAWKATSNGAGANAWAIIASPTAFYMINEYDRAPGLLGANFTPLTNDGTGGFFFGEYKKNYLGHTMNVALIGSHAVNNSTYTQGKQIGKRAPAHSSFYVTFNASNVHYLARPYAGPDGAAVFALTSLHYTTPGQTGGDDTSFGGNGPGLIPSTVDAKIRVSKIELIGDRPTYELIGSMPGMFAMMGFSYISAGQSVIDGVGDLSGNQYFVANYGSANGTITSNPGQVLINITNWDL